MKISLKTFITGLVVFYILVAAIASTLRINDSGGWSEVERFIITKWFLIPIFSLISGIMGYVLLKNIWIAAVTNFVCCLCVMTLLYLNLSDADSTILDWIKYSLVISIITFFSSSITYFIRKAYLY